MMINKMVLFAVRKAMRKNSLMNDDVDDVGGHNHDADYDDYDQHH
jgi:hypothetical protein